MRELLRFLSGRSREDRPGLGRCRVRRRDRLKGEHRRRGCVDEAGRSGFLQQVQHVAVVVSCAAPAHEAGIEQMSRQVGVAAPVDSSLADRSPEAVDGRPNRRMLLAGSSRTTFSPYSRAHDAISSRQWYGSHSIRRHLVALEDDDDCVVDEGTRDGPVGRVVGVALDEQLQLQPPRLVGDDERGAVVRRPALWSDPGVGP